VINTWVIHKRDDKKVGTRGGQGGQGSSDGKCSQQWSSFWSPWTGSIQMWPGSRPPLTPMPQPRPPQQQHHHQQQALSQQQLPAPSAASTATSGLWAPLPPGFYNPLAGLPTWDQQSLASAFNTTMPNQPQNTDWYFDTGASSHMTSRLSALSRFLPPQGLTPPCIIVGNGSLLPVTPLALLIYLVLFVLTMYSFHHNSLRISFQYASSLPTIIVLLNLTPLVVL